MVSPSTAPATELAPVSSATVRSVATDDEDPAALDFAEGLIGDISLLRRRVEHLLADRARRSRIDQARGVLMHRYGMDAFTAFRTLQRWSRQVELSVDELSLAVVILTVGDEVAELPRTVTHTVSRLLRRELALGPDQGHGARSVSRRS